MLDQQIDSFINHIKAERGLSPNTVSAYARDLARFAAWLAESGIGSASGCGPSDVAGFMASLPAKGLSGRSQARTLVAVRQFFRYMLEEKELDSNPALRIDIPRAVLRLPVFLDAGEVEALLGAPKGDTPAALRDAAILEVLYSAGLRASELCSLTINDADLETGCVTVTGKGRKQRMVPLGDIAVSKV
ncbi:MAG: site-specific integrase, partial [Myxococcota bacterium]